MPDEEKTVSKATLVATAVDWFLNASPLRKLQDVAVVSVALLVAGTAWTIYQSKEEIVDAIISRDFSPPHLDVKRAADGLHGLWPRLEPLGCVAVSVYAVDLDTNTIELVATEGSDETLLHALRQTGRRTTFISGSLSSKPDALRVAANMLQGDALFGVQPLRNYPGINFPESGTLFVPLPDEPGRLLLGIVACNWPISEGKTDSSVEVRTARLEVMEYASEVVD